MRFIVGLAGALLVSACAPDGSSDPTGNGAEEAKSVQLPRAGRYRITEISEIFGTTPGVAGNPASFEACLPDQSEEDLISPGGMHCTAEQVQVQDGDASATLSCSAPGTDVQDVRVEYRGSYSADGAELTGDVVLPDGMMRLSRKLERIGDC